MLTISEAIDTLGEETVVDLINEAGTDQALVAELEKLERLLNMETWK